MKPVKIKELIAALLEAIANVVKVKETPKVPDKLIIKRTGFSYEELIQKPEEPGSVKAILINAKDNTMSYFFTDADFDNISWGFTRINFVSTAIYVNEPFNRGQVILDGDWGFYININNRMMEVDPEDIPYDETIRSKYDGSYDTHPVHNWPNSLGGYKFLGDAVIITDEFTIEQLSQMVKCFYMKKIDDPDAVLPRYDKYGWVVVRYDKYGSVEKADNPDVVLSRFDLIEHSSHPKIIGMAGDGKDLELRN